jgi:hypothetical protein
VDGVVGEFGVVVGCDEGGVGDGGVLGELVGLAGDRLEVADEDGGTDRVAEGGMWRGRDMEGEPGVEG